MGFHLKFLIWNNIFIIYLFRSLIFIATRNDGIAWRDTTYLSHQKAIFDKANGDYELIKSNMLRCQ